jgi:predicted amidohydrolase
MDDVEVGSPGENHVELRVAGAQMAVGRDIAANAETIRRAIEFAREEDADILLTPEGSLSGYTHEFDQPAADAALVEVAGAATEAGIGLALGTCFVEPDDGKCYNQVRFYAADGEYLGFHSKTLRCGSMTKPTKGEINHYAASPLRTFEVRGITVGALICNDLWANPGCTPMPDPHLTQQLSDMGARVILHAINGGRSASEWSDVAWNYHESNLRMRAQAGGLWVVPVDNCHPSDLRCSCPSGVIDASGQWVVQAPVTGEEFFAHTIDLGD